MGCTPSTPIQVEDCQQYDKPEQSQWTGCKTAKAVALTGTTTPPLPDLDDTQDASSTEGVGRIAQVDVEYLEKLLLSTSGQQSDDVSDNDEDSPVANDYNNNPTMPSPLVRQNQAALWYDLGRHFLDEDKNLEQAEHLVRQALTAVAEHDGEDGDVVFVAWANTLVMILEAQHDHAAAEAYLRQIMRHQQDTMGSTHPRTLQTSQRLAQTLQAQGKGEPAEVLYRFILMHTRDIDCETTCSYQLAWLLSSTEQAEMWWRKAMPLAQTTWGFQHVRTLTCQAQLAKILCAKDEDGTALEEAQALFAHTMSTRQQVLGAHHPETMDVMNDLATLWNRQHKYAAAEGLWLQLYQIQNEVCGRQHEHTINTREQLAYLYMAQKQWTQAEQWLEQTLRCFAKGTDMFRIVACQVALAQTFAAGTKWDRAAVLWQDVVDDVSTMPQSDKRVQVWHLQALEGLATAHAHMGHKVEAKTH